MKVFDGHSDILMDVLVKSLIGERNIIEGYHIDKLRKGGVFLIVLPLWLDPEKREVARKNALLTLDYLEGELDESSHLIHRIIKYEDIGQGEAEGKIGIILGMEGMFYIGKDLGWIEKFYQRGIRTGSLTWNEENPLATGIWGDKNRGLTKLGREAMSLMEDLGILLDVSHLNETSFWDVIRSTRGPVIASHSNAYSLCPHPRNLKDEQIIELVRTGGLVGVNAWPDFLDVRDAKLTRLVDHIDYLVELVGINHVACGFDFCDFVEEDAPASFPVKSKETEGFKDASYIQKLFLCLRDRGYGIEDMEKIAYKNLMRIYRRLL